MRWRWHYGLGEIRRAQSHPRWPGHPSHQRWLETRPTAASFDAAMKRAFTGPIRDQLHAPAPDMIGRQAVVPLAGGPEYMIPSAFKDAFKAEVEASQAMFSLSMNGPGFLPDYTDPAQHLAAHKEFLNMSKNPKLDQPVTLGELVEAYNALKREGKVTPSFKQVVTKLAKDATQSDFIKVDFGGPTEYTYRLNAQPKGRRVQPGDLVTVPASVMSSFPQVVRVTEVDVTPPKTLSTKRAVAISPEDAKRIETALGKVPSYNVYNDGTRKV